MSSTLYLVVFGGAALLALLLLGFAFLMVSYAKSDLHKEWMIAIFLISFILILSVDYFIMYLAITNYGLIEHELLNKVFSIPVNYENDIWFNIGNTDINYSIVRAGLKLLGMVAAVLGVIGTIVRMIAKSRKK